MAVNLAPIGNGFQFLTATGAPLAGGQLYTYTAGTSTPQATYTTSAGSVQNANPIVLGSDGRPPQEIWLSSGVSYKFVLQDSLGNLVATYDNLIGINDVSLTVAFSEWQASNLTPTYVNATTFTVVGVQTNTFPVNRRVQCTVNAGTVYGYVSSSTYANPNTTVVLVLDSGSLDSGLSVVNIGLLNSTNLSVPQQLVRSGSTIGGALLEGKSSNIASASTVDLSTATGNEIHITGNAGPITSFGTVNAGAEFTLIFDSNPTVNYNAASLVIPGQNNKTVTAGDTWKVLSEGAGNWRVISIQPSQGNAIAGANSDITSLSALASINGGAVSGFGNFVINGCCRVARRGAVAAANAALTYGGCDRIAVGPSGFTTFAGTIAQGSGFASAAFNSGMAQGLTAVTTTGAGAVQFETRLRAADVFRLNGKTVSLNFTVYQDTGAPLTATNALRKANSLDNFGAVTVLATGAAASVASLTPTRVTLTTTLGGADASNGLSLLCTLSGVGAVTNKNFYVGDIMLVVGSVVPTILEPRPITIEEQLCYPYYPFISAGNQYEGAAASTTLSTVNINFDSAPRVAPTGMVIPALSNFSVADAIGNSFAPAGLAFSSAGQNTARIAVTTTAGSPTLAAKDTMFLTIGAAGSIGFTGCEL